MVSMIGGLAATGAVAQQMMMRLLLSTTLRSTSMLPKVADTKCLALRACLASSTIAKHFAVRSWSARFCCLASASPACRSQLPRNLQLPCIFFQQGASSEYTGLVTFFMAMVS